jgi:hypothetical protein
VNKSRGFNALLPQRSYCKKASKPQQAANFDDYQEILENWWGDCGCRGLVPAV